MGATRERRIVETLVELAETAPEDLDLSGLLHRVTEWSVELLGCIEAGVLVFDAAGALQAVASSGTRAESLARLQADHGEGPSPESFVRGETVGSENLVTDTARWPIVGPAALSHDFRSLHALPMRTRGETVGALTLFYEQPGALDARGLTLAQGIADLVAGKLVQARIIHDSRAATEELQSAISRRVVIEQAKGMLAERHHISVDAAFSRIRAHARANNLKLSGVARDLVLRRMDLTGRRERTG